MWTSFHLDSLASSQRSQLDGCCHFATEKWSRTTTRVLFLL